MRLLLPLGMFTLVGCGDTTKEIEVIDFDGDGFNQEDCDDNNASVYFSASEVCDEVTTIVIVI